MIDDDLLRRRAREALQAGKVPHAQPHRIWGGNGFGASCAICDALIEKDEVGYQLEFAEAEDRAQAQELHAHARCFAAWELERTRSQG